MASPLQRSAAEVEAALAESLRRQQHEEPSRLQEFFEWLQEALSFEATSRAAEGLFWFVIVSLIVLASFVLARMMRPVARRATPAAEVAEGPRAGARVRALLREAAEARAAGDLRLALRKQLFALILGLGRRGDLVYRDAWTNRELLEHGQPSREVDALLRPLVVELEAKEFGRVPVSVSDVERLEALCREHLSAWLAEAERAA